MKTEYTIRLEQNKDYRATEELTREAFYNVYRPGCLEHYVWHRFRNGKDFIPSLDFVMEKDGKIIGHIMYAKSRISADDGREIPVVTFGPVSILPSYQNKGYGTALIEFSMQRAKESGAKAIAITGNFGFYRRFGFKVAKTAGIRYFDDPDAEYFLIAELEKGFLNGVSGTYKDPEEYFVDETEAEEFDKTFPEKERR